MRNTLLSNEMQLLGKENELIRLRKKEKEVFKALFQKTDYPIRLKVVGADLYKYDTKVKPFDKKELPQLEESLNQCYNNFAIRWRQTYPTLNEQELAICFLIKATAKTGTIAIIVSMNANSVTTKKRKILKKMGICGTDISLDDFLDIF